MAVLPMSGEKNDFAYRPRRRKIVLCTAFVKGEGVANAGFLLN